MAGIRPVLTVWWTSPVGVDTGVRLTSRLPESVEALQALVLSMRAALCTERVERRRREMENTALHERIAVLVHQLAKLRQQYAGRSGTLDAQIRQLELIGGRRNPGRLAERASHVPHLTSSRRNRLLVTRAPRARAELRRVVADQGALARMALRCCAQGTTDTGSRMRASALDDDTR